jgi:putative FmdB family regulatory protein
MPIYEYRCEACGHELEQMQKISDPPLTDCPACGQPQLRKKISAAAFRLKGGGWYETDFKQDKKKNLHDSGEKKDSGAAAGGAGDSSAVDKAASKSSSGETTVASKPAETPKPATKSAAAEKKPAA